MTGVDLLFSTLIRVLWYLVDVHREGGGAGGGVCDREEGNEGRGEDEISQS